MDAASGRVVGRYVLYDEIASGGMATVHLGRMLGQVGFARVVAVKRLHPHLARDPEFVAMFLDEARLAAGVRHQNVVATLDVVAMTGELFLVMEYVEGDSLSHLIRATRRRKQYVKPAIVSSVACGMLYGLHAAHVAHDERGAALEIVHRDVSPQNILIGVDGATRVADFGVAKASRRLMETEAGRMKGKFSYMSPEQVRRDVMDHRADVFSAGICTWEAFTGRHLFTAEDPARAIVKLLEMPIEPPSRFVEGIPPEVDAIVLRALERDPDKRFQSAREMAIALEDALPPAIPRKVGEWVESLVGPQLEQRSRRLAEMQLDSQSELELQQIAREISSQSVAPPPAEAAVQKPASERPVVPRPASVPAAVAAAPAPAPSAPAPSAPAPTVPASSEPVRSEPAKSEPAKSEPAPTAPIASAEPAPSEPAASEPAASEPAASEPAASEPAASVSATSEPASAEPEAEAAEETSESAAASIEDEQPTSMPVPSLDGAPPLYSPDQGTPVSQMSGLLSASYTDPPPLRERARSLPLIAIFSALAVIALGSIVIVASSSSPEPTPGASAPRETARPPTQPERTPQPQPEPERLPEPEAAPPAAAEKSPEPSAKPAAPKPTEPTPEPAVKPVKPVAPKGAGCNPPYTIENGIKRFKRHCI